MKTNAKSECRQIKLFYLLAIFSAINVFVPIEIIYFKESGLDLSKIFLMQSIFSVAILLFEVPSGYIADKVGRKFSMSLAYIGSQP